MPSLQEILSRLVDHEDLTAADTDWVLDQVLTDAADPVSMAAFLVALRVKRETVAEVTGFTQAMLRHALPISVSDRAVDVVGTGGDGANTVNISTMASITVAAAGLTVVKHGNRAATSKSGSADVLAALGVNLDLSPERVEELATEIGITFCFAQVFHPSMRYAMPIRKALGVPTTFNILGPLTNPAQPAATAIGSSSIRVAPVMAGVIAAQGREALIFHGDDGLDELAPTGSATIWEVRRGEISQHRLDPVGELGMSRIQIADIRGGAASYNAEIARKVFAGEPGPILETVILNAAAGLVADGTLPGLATGSLSERFGVAMSIARDAIESGAAAAKLDTWIEASNSL